MSNPDAARTVSLTTSPFNILDVGVWDTRARIIEHADVRSLHLDSSACQQARMVLTTPRLRVSAEIAWFPGISPSTAESLVSSIGDQLVEVTSEIGLPPLVRANLMCYMLEMASSDDCHIYTAAAFVRTLAEIVELFDPIMILQNVNADRAISGFPLVGEEKYIIEELKSRRRHYVRAITEFLQAASFNKRVDFVNALLERRSQPEFSGRVSLVDDIIDAYAIEVQPELDAEFSNARERVEHLMSAVADRDGDTGEIHTEIEQALERWRRIAQPIKQSMSERGLSYSHGQDVFYSLRGVGIDIFNKLDSLEDADQLIRALEPVFGDVPELREALDVDLAKLARLGQDAERVRLRENEMRASITFSGEIGLIFKNTLSISPDGVAWKDRLYSLESIKVVRWGGVRHSTNGIPTGTSYTIGFGHTEHTSVVELRNEALYNKFIECLWRGVCIRLMFETAATLKLKQSRNYGSICVRDSNVVLPRHGLFSGGGVVTLNWNEVHVWSAGGEFFVGSKSDKKIYGSASYISHWNSHIIEHLIRGAFSKGCSALSDYTSV